MGPLKKSTKYNFRTKYTFGDRKVSLSEVTLVLHDEFPSGLDSLPATEFLTKKYGGMPQEFKQPSILYKKIEKLGCLEHTKDEPEKRTSKRHYTWVGDAIERLKKAKKRREPGIIEKTKKLEDLVTKEVTLSKALIKAMEGYAFLKEISVDEIIKQGAIKEVLSKDHRDRMKSLKDVYPEAYERLGGPELEKLEEEAAIVYEERKKR